MRKSMCVGPSSNTQWVFVNECEFVAGCCCCCINAQWDVIWKVIFFLFTNAELWTTLDLNWKVFTYGFTLWEFDGYGRDMDNIFRNLLKNMHLKTTFNFVCSAQKLVLHQKCQHFFLNQYCAVYFISLRVKLSNQPGQDNQNYQWQIRMWF